MTKIVKIFAIKLKNPIFLILCLGTRIKEEPTLAENYSSVSLVIQIEPIDFSEVSPISLMVSSVKSSPIKFYSNCGDPLDEKELFFKTVINFDDLEINRQSFILKTRGGSWLEIIKVLFDFWLAYVWFVYGLLPDIDAFRPQGQGGAWGVGYIDGKPPEQQAFSLKEYPFERKYLENKLMCSSSLDQDGFIMSRNEAMKILNDNFGSSVSIKGHENLRISEWQCVKKLYHSKNFDISPESYGFTKEDMSSLRGKGGIVAHVQRGGKLPPIEYVRDFQSKIKAFCESSMIDVKDITYLDHRERQAIGFSSKTDFTVVAFDKVTGDLITPHRITPKEFSRYALNNTLGSIKGQDK